MAALISGGTFVNSGSCTFSGFKAVDRSTFVGCIQNNGSCAGSGDYVMTYGDMLACAVTGPALQSLNITIPNHTFTGGTTVTISDASHQVTLTTPGASHCLFVVKINGTTVISSSSSAIYTGGATGTITAQGGNLGGTCSVGSAAFSWYH